MKQEEILNLNYNSFVEYLTGLFIIGIGQGKKPLDLMYITFTWMQLWEEKHKKEKK